jgi:hypothetical protein
VYEPRARVRHPARARLVDLLRKAQRVGFGVGQAVRLGALDAGALGERALDRALLSVRSAPDAPRSPRVRAVQLSVGVAAALGSVRGLLAPKPRRG